MTDNAREARRRRKAELALRALAEQGNPKKAAEYLGIAETTVNKLVREYCALNGFDGPVQAAFTLAKQDKIGTAERPAA